MSIHSGVERVINELRAIAEPDSEHDVTRKRVAAYWWGAADEEVPWWLGLCKLVNGPVAQCLYIAHVADDARHARGMKDWAYGVAAEYAVSRGGGVRRRAVVEAYRPEWGRQAARDGLAAALWPQLQDEIPGRDKRCAELKCGHQAYQRVRDEVTRAASDLIVSFSMDMDQCRDNKFSRDFIARWEQATGREWIAL